MARYALSGAYIWALFFLKALNMSICISMCTNPSVGGFFFALLVLVSVWLSVCVFFNRISLIHSYVYQVAQAVIV